MLITENYTTIACCHDGCGLTFAVPESLWRQWRNDSTWWWYCPNGHRQHYGDEASDRTKLKRAEARERHLQDQLQAAEREAEQRRQTIIRERSRFANGVCPCCNRSFTNVRRHMKTQHPDYDVTRVEHEPAFKCSCGRRFDTYRGLRTHQGHNRPDEWWTKPKWRKHTTLVGA